jgi:hypothetical protein
MSLSPGIIGAKTQLVDGVQVDVISSLIASAITFTNNIIVNGTSSLSTSFVTGAVTLGSASYVSCSGSSAYAVTLPTAVGNTGLVYTIKSNMNTGILLTVNTTSSQTIDGATSVSLSRYSSLQVISNGSNWEIF